MPTRQQVIIIKNSNNIFNHHNDNANHSHKEQQYQSMTSVVHHLVPSAVIYIFWIFHINTHKYFWAAWTDNNNKLKNNMKPIPTTIQAKVFTNQFLMATSRSPLVARQMVVLKCQQVCTGICPDWSWSSTKFSYWFCESCALACHTQKDSPPTHSLNRVVLYS